MTPPATQATTPAVRAHNALARLVSQAGGWPALRARLPSSRSALLAALALAGLWLLRPHASAELGLGSRLASAAGDPLLGGVAAIGALLALAALFVWIFVGDPTPRRVKAMFGFSYGSALLAVLVPYAVVAAYAVNPDLDRLMRGIPIGVLPGCPRPAAALEGARGAAQPPGACATAPVQWVINIGGYLPALPPEPPRQLAAAADALPDVAQGQPQGVERAALAIEGGLVVPLYFVVLSLMGASVGMARRIPEYQRGYESWQSLVNARGSGADPAQLAELAGVLEIGSGKALLPEAVRERLIFQIAQVWSAPLIAIAAYQLFSPQDVATTVAVGFASGFAAEPILMMFRRVADALAQPAAAK